MGKIEESLAGRLQELRRAAGLSQAQLGAGSRINVQTISRYERGALAPSVDALERIAKVLRVPITAFFEQASAIPDLPRDVLKIVTLLESAEPAMIRRIYRMLRALLA